MVSTKVKKRCSYIVLGLFYLMAGIEYAVILPTLWLYISHRFHAEQYVLGVLLAAYSLTALLSAPLYGRWLDVSRKPRLILAFGILWQIGGNIMYFIGISEWFILGSRLVNGFGAGAESVILAEIARATTEEERTGILSILISMRQMGLLFGPGFNVFLRLADFKIGPFAVDKYSSPGAFMACMWFLQGLLILFFYTDLNKIKQQEAAAQSTEHSKRQSESESYDPLIAKESNHSCNSNTDHEIERKESYGSINKDVLVTEGKAKESDAKAVPKITLKLLFNEYIREEIIVIFAVQFNSFFNQMTIETMVTPLSDKLLHWGELENSIMYCLAGVEVIAVFMLVRFLSKKFVDRTLMLFGSIVLMIANVYLMYVIPRCSPDTPKENLPYFIVGAIIDMLALPFLVVCSVSLYTKLTRKEMQGLSQGIRRSIVGMAFILSPLWASSTLNYPYIMFGVNISLLVISLFVYQFHWGIDTWVVRISTPLVLEVMQILSFKKLKPISTTSEATTPTGEPEDNMGSRTEESKPLLS